MATTTDWLMYFFIYVAWWLIPLVAIWLMRRSMAKYPIEATIYEKRGEKVLWTRDRLGRFDKPVVSYRFKKTKGDSIPIPKYDWVLQAVFRPTNFFEKIANMLSGTIGQVTLFKYGSKQYKPINIKLADGNIRQKLQEITDEKGRPVMINVYEVINPAKSMSKLDFEVIDWDDINHMTQELRAIATRRAPILDVLQKYGPLIGAAIMCLVLIIGGYYYKEMITKAPACADWKNQIAKDIQGNPATQPTDSNINKQPAIPIVGDMFNPG